MNLLYLMNIKLIILNIDGEKNCYLKCVANTLYRVLLEPFCRYFPRVVMF